MAMSTPCVPHLVMRLNPYVMCTSITPGARRTSMCTVVALTAIWAQH